MITSKKNFFYTRTWNIPYFLKIILKSTFRTLFNPQIKVDKNCIVLGIILIFYRITRVALYLIPCCLYELFFFQDIPATEKDLADIFQVAHVQLEENAEFPEEYSWTSCKSCLHLCNRCRRLASDVQDELCERCKYVVEGVRKTAAANQVHQCLELYCFLLIKD